MGSLVRMAGQLCLLFIRLQAGPVVGDWSCPISPRVLLRQEHGRDGRRGIRHSVRPYGTRYSVESAGPEFSSRATMPFARRCAGVLAADPNHRPEQRGDTVCSGWRVDLVFGRWATHKSRARTDREPIQRRCRACHAVPTDSAFSVRLCELFPRCCCRTRQIRSTVPRGRRMTRQFVIRHGRRIPIPLPLGAGNNVRFLRTA